MKNNPTAIKVQVDDPGNVDRFEVQLYRGDTLAAKLTMPKPNPESDGSYKLGLAEVSQGLAAENMGVELAVWVASLNENGRSSSALASETVHFSSTTIPHVPTSVEVL